MFNIINKLIRFLNKPVHLKKQEHISVTYEALGMHGVITCKSPNKYDCKLIKTDGTILTKSVSKYEKGEEWLYKTAEYINQFG